jgi:hypothetical protein
MEAGCRVFIKSNEPSWDPMSHFVVKRRCR